jgi:serine/threonine protein kinase
LIDPFFLEELMSMIGKTLVHYEISAELGKGGMGEVYQAKDTKLGRDVAIKVLPEEFALDKDRVTRFQREAKLLASLNHPNIAAIYGLEESEGTHFLVMELIEGDTLRDRIKSGPIPVEEALKLALQMAEALEAAHEKGVIHRDLKPANIKVTPDGKVKILDFGLAKAYAGDQGNINLADSPTISVAATQQGVILGTAAYMSPEQAKGKSVDKRADIWAFGAVLYEMLTGRQAFQGEDVSETLASVIKGDSNLGLLPANIHPRVREVITRCLQKEQKKRYRDIGEAQYEIEQVLADPSGLFVQPSLITKPKKKLRVGIPWVATIFILGLIIAWLLKPAPPPEPRHVIRFDYNLQEEQQFVDLTNPLLAISPDGSKFVYCTSEGLYLRSMVGLDARLISGTDEYPNYPFFSPDGQWIGYVSQGKLKKIAIGGGAPVTICDAGTQGGFNWTSDNRILQGSGSNIWWVSGDGGEFEPLFEEKGYILSLPQMLPDGESVLFTTGFTPPHKIIVHSLKSGESKELFEGGHARYINTGHIVYCVANNLYARPFDLETLEVTGGPVNLVEGVLSASWVWQYAVSDSGTLAYIPGQATSINKRTLVWVDYNGKEELIEAKPDEYSYPKISPDGRQIALNVGNLGNMDIWIWDLVRKTMTRLTFDESISAFPLWTPDGKRIVFVSNREKSFNIYWKAADGTGKVEPLGPAYSGAMASLPSSWSGDGKTLVLMEIITSGNMTYNIGALTVDGEHEQRSLLKEIYVVTEPQISPNGKWMAYTSDESGQAEVFVRPFPDVDSGGRWQVSTDGGRSPLWSPDGGDLFYRNGDAVMAVSVTTEPNFSLETPRTLFRGKYLSFSNLGNPRRLNSWDISPDGKRFLMIKPPVEIDDPSTVEVPRKINIVVNWFEELKERVPVD